MMLSARFRLLARALGGRNFTGGAASSPLAVLSQWSRPSLESAHTGREPPNPPDPPLAASELAAGGGGPAGPAPAPAPRPPRPGPPAGFGFSIGITVNAPAKGPEVSFIFGFSDD